MDPSLKRPKADARAVGLRYINATQTPGIRRTGKAGDFHYHDPAGKPITDLDVLERIRKLVLPPAWTDVWIAPSANAHLQATGRDTRGRKQYRYHQQWRSLREETKFARMPEFGAALPKLRERVEKDLALSGLKREKILATVVRLLEITLIRVGNEEYVKANRSYGLTTLRNRHVSIHGNELAFEFRGKSGKQHSIGLHDRRVANILRRCKELPGAELFQYLDENGERHSIDSQDVNDYVREIGGESFTAKNFRTWAGSVCALDALLECPPCSCQTELKAVLSGVVKSLAERLGNTPTVCRKHYIHPVVFEAFGADGLAAMRARAKCLRDSERAERALTELLAQDPALNRKQQITRRGKWQ